MSKFDFFGVSDQGTSKMPIINPNDGTTYTDKAGKEAFIEIGHLHGPEARAFDNDFRRAATKLPTVDGLSAEESFLVHKLAAITKSWYLVGADGDGVDLPFSRDAAVELYANRWIRLQVAAHSSAYANFSKASSKN